MKYIMLIGSFLLIIGCATVEKPKPQTTTHSLKDNVTQLKEELALFDENIIVKLEDDNETINISFENDMLFEFNEYSVKSEFKSTLKAISEFLIKHQEFKVIIEGHTDSVGDKQSNQILSEKRALSVAEVLIENNVSSQLISSIGYGEEKPKYDNETEEGRSGNRRAEIKLKNNFGYTPIEESIPIVESETVFVEDEIPVDNSIITKKKKKKKINKKRKKKVKKKKKIRKKIPKKHKKRPKKIVKKHKTVESKKKLPKKPIIEKKEEDSYDEKKKSRVEILN